MDFSESFQNPYNEAIISCTFLHPLSLQKEPRSVMVKSTKTNQRKGFSQWLHYMKNA